MVVGAVGMNAILYCICVRGALRCSDLRCDGMLINAQTCSDLDVLLVACSKMFRIEIRGNVGKCSDMFRFKMCDRTC